MPRDAGQRKRKNGTSRASENDKLQAKFRVGNSGGQTYAFHILAWRDKAVGGANPTGCRRSRVPEAAAGGR